MSNPTPPPDSNRKKIKVSVGVEFYVDPQGVRHPYLLVLDPRKKTGSNQKDYSVEWKVDINGGYEVVLNSVRPKSSNDNLSNPSQSSSKITYDLDVHGNEFKYDLIYTVNGGPEREAYAERPTEVPGIAPPPADPPPKIIIP